MKRNPARGAFFNTAGREIRREKCKRGNIWRNSGEFIFIAVLHPVVDFESSESIVPASIFAKGSKIGKLTRLQIPNFYFLLRIWQHLGIIGEWLKWLKIHILFKMDWILADFTLERARRPLCGRRLNFPRNWSRNGSKTFKKGFKHSVFKSTWYISERNLLFLQI